MAALLLFGGLFALILPLGVPERVGAYGGGAGGPVVYDLPAISFAICGFIAWWRRPRDVTGPLMLAWLLTWMAQFGETSSTAPIVFSLGSALDGASTLALGYVVLVFPEGRLRGRGARATVAIAAIPAAFGVIGMAFYDPRAYGCDRCGPHTNLLLVHADMSALHALTWTGNRLGLVSIFTFVGVLVARYAGATKVGRRVAAPLYLPAIVAALYTAIRTLAFLNSRIGDLVQPQRAALEYVSAASLTAIPLAFLYGMQRARARRARVAVLVRELGATPSPTVLEDALAKSLGDPSLQLGIATGDGYVHGDLQPLALPDPDDPRRTVSRVDGATGPVAVLVHDRALLLDDRELLEAVSAAAALAVENDRLQEDLRERFRELQESRTRILAAADEAQRRVERNLHDGAQQRLVSLVVALRLAELQLGERGDPELRATLADMAEQLNGAIAELRELGRGLHPAVLTEEGLGAAVRALTTRASVPVRIAALPDARFDPAAEAAAYYVVSEALTNAARYAAAEWVVVEIGFANGALRIEISDDGRGGARLEGGSGLRGLADRVEAAGGTLTVESAAGKGTTVEAVIPSSIEAQAPDPATPATSQGRPHSAT